MPFKRPLKLPKTAEEWEEADRMLMAVAASVSQSVTAEEKNSCLCEGIYNAIANNFGTRRPPASRPNSAQTKIKHHDRELKKVTKLKNDARRALRKAKREGESEERVQLLAAQFLSLLRSHSKLKRKSDSRGSSYNIKLERERCHRDFWKFSKELLDDTPRPRFHLIFPRAQPMISSLRHISQGTISSIHHIGCLFLLPLNQVW